MKNFPVLVFLAIFLFSFQPILTVDSPGPSIDDSDFVRTSCNATLYPEVCFASLAGYSAAVQDDPARLARVAIGVTLSKTRELASYLVNLTRWNGYADDRGGSDPRVTGVLRDCFSNIKDAVDEMRDSLKQMRELASAGSLESFRFQMSNVQTWLSAALTAEETCTDGFEGVGDTPAKDDVCERADEVKKLTSNALALVNRYADKAIH